MSRTSHTRFRASHQVSIKLIVWMVCFASLLCCAGICIGILKNEQIEVRRDIESMNDEIVSINLTADQYRARIAAKTSRWAIRDRLAQDKSDLQLIQHGQIESVRRIEGRPAVASK